MLPLKTTLPILIGDGAAAAGAGVGLGGSGVAAAAGVGAAAVELKDEADGAMVCARQTPVNVMTVAMNRINLLCVCCAGTRRAHASGRLGRLVERSPVRS